MQKTRETADTYISTWWWHACVDQHDQAVDTDRKNVFLNVFAIQFKLSFVAVYSYLQIMLLTASAGSA